MDWPLISDFSRMLQNPRVAFRDTGLRSCRVEMDNLGQPKPRSGNFATVYKGFREDGSEFAIRVFNRRADLRREAYQAKSEYLQKNHVFSLVNFQYDEKGVRASDGKLYPLLTMDWVPGITLFEWVRDRCREGYAEALSIGADVWLQVVHEMANAEIVHGDLQHGNVLVDSQGYFKLVDYDCMAVPELFGRENFEIGMEPYQHPARNAQTQMFLGLDNFSALVIYVALRALAAAPQLWMTFVDNTGYDKLLFRKDDIVNPQSSPLYQQLLNSPDQQVRDLTYYLCQLATYRLEDVPTLDEVILWCHSVEDLLSQRDWDRAVQLVERMGPGEQLADLLKPAVEKARRRVECRQAVEAAYAAGREWQVHQLYDRELLSEYPAAEELIERAKRADEAARVLENLQTAKRFKRWKVMLELWEKHREFMEDRPSAQAWKEEIKKVRAAESVRGLLNSHTATNERVLEAWKYLKSLGGHPDGDELWPEVQQRIDQENRVIRLRKQLERNHEPPTVSSDKKLIAAFESSGVNSKSGPADLVATYTAAQQRLEAVKQIRAVATADMTLDGEARIAELGRRLPENYHENLTKRIKRARACAKAHVALTNALKPPRSDLAIFKAYKELSAAGGKPLISEKVRSRVKLAARRVPILKVLRGLTDKTPACDVDQKLLEVWDATLLEKCHDAESWQERHKLAQARRKVLDKIKAAIDQFDKPALTKLLADKLMKGFQLPDDLQRGVDQMDEQAKEARKRQRQNLVKALAGRERGTFAELYDTELVRGICDELKHHRPLAGQWIDQDILPLDLCGLAAPDEGPALERLESGELIARWTWPAAKITDRCQFAVCPEQPAAHATPKDVKKLATAAIRYERWKKNDRCHKVEVQEEWDEAYVAVWAVVDLEFETFYSPPLVLGQIPPAKKARRWGLFGK